MWIKRRLVIIAFLLSFTAAVIVRILFAQNPGIGPHRVDKVELGTDEVKTLLLLMDTNKNGKISKEEFMRFMEAEFDRLDVNKDGELDPKELAQSRIRSSNKFAAVGK